MEKLDKIYMKKGGKTAFVCLYALLLFAFLTLFAAKKLEYIDSFYQAAVTGFFFSLLGTAAFTYFSFVRKAPFCTVIFAGISAGAALLMRFALFDYISDDFGLAISSWIEQISRAPGLSGWAMNIGDYNPPYLYVLTVIAKLPVVPLYATKFFSICADFAIAYYIMRLCATAKKSLNTQVLIFTLALFVPTFLLNSSYWAQCDGIYAAAALAFVYYGVTGRSKTAVALSAVAFAFKLQSIFVLPLLAVFLFTKKIKFSHIFIFPAVFAALLMPVILAGRGVGDTLSIYLNQASAYATLSIFLPNIYQFFYSYQVADDGIHFRVAELIEYKWFSTVGIMLAGTGVVILLYFLWIYRKKITAQTVFTAGFILALGIPYLLPCMHERYFFLAEVFALAVFVFDSKRWFVPFFVTLGSFCAYSTYLFKDAAVLPYFRLLALINLLLILTEIRHLYQLSAVPSAEVKGAFYGPDK
ncbi:MAG: hypothetical protein IJL87_07190 [Clostridia bacterium]|nr:hypothetical protein [Clostridia bacterium]